MSFVSSAAAVKVLTLLLRKDVVPLEKTVEEFNASFPREQHFGALFAATKHLEIGDRCLLSVEERIAGLYLFHALYSKEPVTENPFCYYLIEVSCQDKRSSEERIFALQLLARQISEQITTQTPREIVACLPPPSRFAFSSRDALVERYLPTRHKDQAKGEEGQGQENSNQDSATPAPLAENESSGGNTAGRPALTQFVGSHGFELPFVRPKPPSLPLGPGDVIWMHPRPRIPLWLDGSQEGEDPEELEAARKLIMSAVQAPLLPAQQQEVLKELENKAGSVRSCGLEPAMLPLLVEHNPSIASEVLLKCVKLKAADDYLAMLASMDLTLHSLEVVNRLVAAAQLPPDFLLEYITNCISCCERAEDKFVQNRLVRLVCVFLQSLIKNSAINLQDLFLEVQSFCISFSRVREAAGLFRLLKTLEAADDNSAEEAA